MEYDAIRVTQDVYDLFLGVTFQRKGRTVPSIHNAFPRLRPIVVACRDLKPKKYQSLIGIDCAVYAVRTEIQDARTTSILHVARVAVASLFCWGHGMVCWTEKSYPLERFAKPNTAQGHVVPIRSQGRLVGVLP